MDLGTAIIVAAFGAAGLALAGHGTLAIVTIRKAHREARADYTAKIEQAREENKRDMTEIVDAKFKVIEERMDRMRPPTPEQIGDQVKAHMPPTPTIPEIPTVDEIIAGVRAVIPLPPSIAVELEQFLKSSPGVQWARELAAAISVAAVEQFDKRVQGAAGGALKTDTARVAEVLRGLRFGHVWLDGIWAMAMADPSIVKLLSSGLAKAFAQAGGSTRVLGNEQLALADGSDGTDEYV